MENYQQAKKLIEESQSIHIFPTQDLRADSFPAATALFYGLKKINKKTNLLLNKTPFPQDFVISVKEEKVKISQVFYEKMGNELKIHLKTKKGNLNKENVYFEKQELDQSGLFSQPDLLITLGIISLQKLEIDFQKDLPLILNIDNQTENENFGKVNLIENPSTSLSDIVLKLLRTTGEELPEKDNHSSLPESLLFEKVLKKIKFKGKENIACALLEKEDFEETNSNSLDLSFSLRKLKSDFSPLRDFLLLWQSYNSPLVIKGVFYSLNKNFRQKILDNFEGEQKGEGILFFLPEENLVVARDKILELIE